MTGAPDLPPARPAATVVVVRDGGAGLEVLLLERSQVGAFAGMWVFPGGRVDDGDPGEDELAKARAAAVREAAEEVGLVIDPDALVPWAHWTPPPIQPKRYNTWFFVAPWGGGDVSVDGHEIVDHVWLTPDAALDHGFAMAPPTFVTLHQLRAVPSVAQLVADGPAHGVERFATRHARSGDDAVLMWHGDAGYETADAELPGPRHRLRMTGLRVSDYERS